MGKQGFKHFRHFGGWALMWGLLRLCSGAMAGDAAVRVSTATGLIEVKAALLQEWIAVEAGELLLPGDLLRTRAESSALVTGPEGSQLALAAETTIDVRAAHFESDTRTLALELVLWQGRMTLTAQPLNPASALCLRTPELSLQPADPGARVELAYGKTAGTEVNVLDGTVTLIRGASTFLLRAGQGFPFTEPPPPVEEPTAPPSEPTSSPEEAPSEEAGTRSATTPEAEAGTSPSSPETPPEQEGVPRSSPPSTPASGGGTGGGSSESSPEPTETTPARPAPEGVPAAIWERMSEEERVDLEARLPEMTEEQRETLRQMTVDQWRAARSASRTLDCQTHLQKIGTAFLRYVEEHEGLLPQAEEWTRAIYPYLEAGASWDCPEEDRENTFDYLFNRNLSGMRLSDLRQPRLTILTFEGIPPDESVSGGEADLAPRHEGAVNVLFADGHVRTMTLPLYRNVRWQP